MKGKSGEKEGIGFPQTHNSVPLGLQELLLGPFAQHKDVAQTSPGQ